MSCKFGPTRVNAQLFTAPSSMLEQMCRQDDFLMAFHPRPQMQSSTLKGDLTPITHIPHYGPARLNTNVQGGSLWGNNLVFVAPRARDGCVNHFAFDANALPGPSHRSGMSTSWQRRPPLLAQTN